MSDERLEAGEPCMVSISAGLRPIHKKAVVTTVKPKGYDVLCEGETTERHISEKKAKRLLGRKATVALEIPKDEPVRATFTRSYSPMPSPAQLEAAGERHDVALAQYGRDPDETEDGQFRECPSCAAKPGSPELCLMCRSRRKNWERRGEIRRATGAELDRLVGSVRRPGDTDLMVRERFIVGDLSRISPKPLTQKIAFGVDLAKGPSHSVVAVFERTRPVPKPRPRWQSAEYLKFVGEHDCCGCGKHGPSDAHHWGGSKGMALKVDDLLTVPLCNGCHIEGFHRTGKLPGMTTAETHLRFRETQVALLVEWVLIKFQEVSE